MLPHLTPTGPATTVAQWGAARAQAHHGPQASGPRRGTALCLSGGGFRAVLFHLGAVRRLDELGVLARLRTISGVSGGSVVANLLAHPDLSWPEVPHEPDEPRWPGSRVGGLEELVAGPVRRLTGRNLRTPALASRLGPRGWGRPDSSVRGLAEQLVSVVPWWATDLRESTRSGPSILTSATEIGYGVPWVFADARTAPPRGRVGDHRLGYAAPPPGLRVADAVAASSAYPPFFAPWEIDGRTLGLRGGVPDPEEPVEVTERILRRVQLVDGGVYDNLAVEPVWTDHATVLVSDGGAVPRGRPAASAAGRLWHLLGVASSGQHTTRLRWLRASFAQGFLQGATWSLESPTTVSPVPGHAPEHGLRHLYPSDVVARINSMRTDLDAFTGGEQRVLERHGYLVADASVRRHAPHLWSAAVPLDPPHGEVADAQAARDQLLHSTRLVPLGRR